MTVTDTQLLLFIATSLLVILSPGQDMVIVMSRGITQGARAGMVTAAGVSIGLLGHTALASLGVGALLMASNSLFSAIKIIGAGYLLYLGIRMLAGRSKLDIAHREIRSFQKMFIEGLISNLSNPKITIFYFAFLPQFVSTDVHNPTGYLLALGLSFSLLTLLVKAPIGYFAGIASHWVRQRPGIIQTIHRISGTVLIGFGIKLAMEQR